MTIQSAATSDLSKCALGCEGSWAAMRAALKAACRVASDDENQPNFHAIKIVSTGKSLRVQATNGYRAIVLDLDFRGCAFSVRIKPNDALAQWFKIAPATELMPIEVRYNPLAASDPLTLQFPGGELTLELQTEGESADFEGRFPPAVYSETRDDRKRAARTRRVADFTAVDAGLLSDISTICNDIQCHGVAIEQGQDELAILALRFIGHAEKRVKPMKKRMRLCDASLYIMPFRA